MATGFAARYYAGSDLANRPTVTTIDDRVSTAGVRRNWPLADRPVTARWDGFLLLARSATYRFALVSDGRSYLSVDDRIAIDNGDPHGPRQVTVDVPLERGIHSVRVEYSSAGNSSGVDALWATSAWASLTPLTGRAVSPVRPSPSEFRIRTAIDVTRAVVVAAWTIAFLVLLVAYALVPAVKALVQHHLVSRPTWGPPLGGREVGLKPDATGFESGIPATVMALLALTTVVYATGITWGIPGQGWAPDELIPTDFLDAVDRHFSHGWFSKYPPAHLYVSTIVSAPLLVWRWLDPTAFAASPAPEMMWLLFRAVTVAMGVGAVLMVYICGSYLYGSWAALVAAAIAALTMPAVFYGKVANFDMPYVFWYAVSLASFIRILVHDSRSDYWIFAVTAALAVCTKDQAYGLYGLPAVALLCVRRKHLLPATFVAILTFALCHNLIFNTSGFLSHVRYITGGGSTAFRMFEPTLSGQSQLWQAVWIVARVSMGWPAYLLCLAGLALSIWPALSERSSARVEGRLWWALLPTASYYLTFLAVVGFTYDRFLMPMFVGLALAGGYAVARFDEWAPSLRIWQRAGIAGVLAYTLAYVLAIDVALLRDPRYAVEAWMRTNVPPGATVGRLGPVEYVPRIDRFLTVLVIPTAENIRATALDYLVVNADWIERFGYGSYGSSEFAGYRQLREGRLGYRKVFESRSPITFAGMSFDRRFAAFGTIGYSTLTRLNRPTVVYKREQTPSLLSRP